MILASSHMIKRQSCSCSM